MKTCTRCHEAKPESEFYTNRGRLNAHCKICARGLTGAYRLSHPEKLRQYLKEYTPKRHRFLKEAALAKIGMCCACCGESRFEFLTIDHVNNDGHLHRKAMRHDNLYWWFSKTGGEGYEIQTLCFNCNFGKRYNNGVCPHQTEGSETISKESRATRPEARSPSQEGEDIVRSYAKA